MAAAVGLSVPSAATRRGAARVNAPQLSPPLAAGPVRGLPQRTATHYGSRLAPVNPSHGPTARLRRVQSLSHHAFELSSLVVDGDVADVWWRPLDLGRAEAEVVEDPLDREVIVDVGHDLKRAPALATRERVGVVDLRDQPRPARRAATLLGASAWAPSSSSFSLARAPRARLP